MDINDLVFCYRQMDELVKTSTQSRNDIDYKMCVETFGYGKGDTLPLNDEFIREQMKISDSQAKRDIQVSQFARIDYISFFRQYVKLIIANWVVETDVEALRKFGMIK